MGLLDMIGHKYPSTNFHELNLDWCITAVLQLQKAFEDFSAGNKLIFANPLQHDLTKTYAKNTIVVDSVSGSAYLSLAAVPVGVQLDDAEYWLPVFDFAGYVTRANQNFTDNYFSGTDRSPHALAVGDWVVLDDVLYKVTQAIAADGIFIIDTNIVHFTVEEFLKDFIASVTQTINTWHTEMTGTIQQYKNDIDASEAAFTAYLQAQFEQVLSGATVDSEVINARVGFDGTIYNTLKNSIVGQILDCIHGNKDWNSGTTGYIYADFDDCATNTIYFYSPSDWTAISHQPANEAGTLITMSVNTATDVGKVQLYFSNSNRVYFRYMFLENLGWHDWIKISTPEDILNCIHGNQNWNSGSTGYIYADFDDCATNTIYFYSPSSWSGISHQPANEVGTLITMSVNTATDVGKVQLYFSNSNRVYFRYLFTENLGWHNWIKISTPEDLEPFTHAIRGNAAWTSGGHGYVITDLNDAATNRIYFFSPSSAEWTNLSNFPVKKAGTLLTYSVDAPSNAGWVQFYIVNGAGEAYIRTRFTSGQNWSAWHEFEMHREVHIVKSATGTYKNEYTNLKDGIDFATARNNSIVYIHEGTWNVLTELGDTYLANVSSSQRGIVLKNGVHVICLPDAYLTCNYTGGASNVEQWLSVFNTGVNGCTIENANIEFSNIRYGIHDERDTDTDFYQNKYINCHLSGNHPNIGGGLGKHGQIIIDSCYFTQGDVDHTYNPVFYHNTAAASGRSNITVKNCMFAGTGSTFSLQWHGTTTDITRAYVSGNSFGAAPFTKANQVTDLVENVQLLAYCNEIRS